MTGLSAAIVARFPGAVHVGGREQAAGFTAESTYTPAMEDSLPPDESAPAEPQPQPQPQPSRRRRLWLLPVAVVCLCGAAALAFTLRGADWLMPAVATRIEAASGLRLGVTGPVQARVAPWLGLRAAAVRLAPAGANTAPLVRADTAEIELSWVALLQGRVRIVRLHLVHAQILSGMRLPSGDIEIAADGPAIHATLSSEAATVDADAHRDGEMLALDHVTLRMGRGGLSAVGTGRLSLRDPVRLVATTAVSAAGRPLGDVDAAFSYSADGLVLERANWRRTDGLEINLFGHAAPDQGALRFEGGIDAASESDKGFDASAAFDGALGDNGVTASVSNIDVRAEGAHLTGEAKYRSGATAQLVTSLRLDRLDIDALRQSPLAPLAAVAAAAFEGEAGVHLRIDGLAAGGKTIGEGIIVDASRHAETLDLHELAARSLWGVPFHATGRLAFGPAPVVAFDPIQVSYSGVDANGRLTLDLSGARPVLDGDLAAGPLQLDRVFAGPPSPPPEPMTRRALAQARAKPAAAPALSTKPLGLPATFPIDADVGVSTPRLAWRETQLADVRARLQLRARQLAVTGLTAGAYGGRLTFNGRIEQAEPPHLSAELQLAGADLGTVLADLGGQAVAVHGDLSAELTADGRSPADLVNTLAGTVAVANGTGTVTGIDMASLSERLKQRPTRPTDIFQLARAAGGGRTAFSGLHGHFRIDRGVARTDDLQMTAPTAAARLSGSIDLPRRGLNVVSEFQLTDPPGVPPLVVKLDGPFVDPRRVFDISRLQAYLLHRPDATAPAGRPH